MAIDILKVIIYVIGHAVDIDRKAISTFCVGTEKRTRRTLNLLDMIYQVLAGDILDNRLSEKFARVNLIDISALSVYLVFTGHDGILLD